MRATCPGCGVPLDHSPCDCQLFADQFDDEKRSGKFIEHPKKVIHERTNQYRNTRPASHKSER